MDLGLFDSHLGRKDIYYFDEETQSSIESLFSENTFSLSSFPQGKEGDRHFIFVSDITRVDNKKIFEEEYRHCPIMVTDKACDHPLPNIIKIDNIEKFCHEELPYYKNAQKQFIEDYFKQQCFELTERVKRRTIKLLDQGEALQEQVKIFEASEAQISTLKNIQQVKKLIKDFCSQFKTSLKFYYKMESEIDWGEIYSNNQIVFPLTDVEHDTYLIISNYQDSDENIFILFLFELLQRINYIFDSMTIEKEGIDLWEEPFNSLPYPLVLMSQKGDVLLHNSHFSKTNILPKECLSLENGDHLERNGKVFQVKRIINPEGLLLFVFIYDSLNENDESIMRQVTNEELGIISSSIAHELNNPLAGILAAITLLELEDWEEDEQQALSEMKEGATRCKNLVQIFLGFSRAREGEVSSGKLSYSVEQAIELLRARMVENNMKLDFEYVGEGRFGKDVNPSMSSMIFYLLFSEVLTQFGHYRLIENTGNLLKAKITELERKIEISFTKQIKVLDSIKSSKLIQYLLEREGLFLEFQYGKIILSDWKLL
ncbi:MAG: HAMP domain-containing histidine kinase [Oligoflexia bacterium]|nr:HAMP domain-containing histidine kinase [Oligoflexia bacterium]